MTTSDGITLAIIHFGSDEWKPLLDLWLKRYHQSGCKLRVAVVTDSSIKEIPEELQTSWIRCENFDKRIMRPDRAFDVKGALVLHALENISGPVLTIDTDAFLMKDPTSALSFLDTDMAMGFDPGQRLVDGYPGLVERNAGVLYWGANRQNEAIREKYVEIFGRFRSTAGPLLEQTTWTLVHHWLQNMNRAVDLPRQLNWSHLWGDESRAIIFHEHGLGKWKKIPELAASVMPSSITGLHREWIFPRDQAVAVVLAHGRVEATVIRHIPWWKKIADRIIVVIPEDDDISLPEGIEVVKVVKNDAAYSAATSERSIEALKIGLETKLPYVWLIEYDSLVWGPLTRDLLPLPGQVGACLWHNETVSPIAPKTFKSPYYLHFPQLWTRLAIEKVIANPVPFEAEHGYTDRYIGWSCYLSKIYIVDWNRLGRAYSQENITGHPNRILKCIAAVKNGAIFSHGIKHEDGLKSIGEITLWGKSIK